MQSQQLEDSIAMDSQAETEMNFVMPKVHNKAKPHLQDSLPKHNSESKVIDCDAETQDESATAMMIEETQEKSDSVEKKQSDAGNQPDFTMTPQKYDTSENNIQEEIRKRIERYFHDPTFRGFIFIFL
jgi:hypothetical protein